MIGEPVPSRSTSCRRSRLMPSPTPMVVTLMPLLSTKVFHWFDTLVVREEPPGSFCSLGLPSLMKKTWLFQFGRGV
ncbi:hypothetical protein D3C84_1221050 [compost metagenome]